MDDIRNLEMVSDRECTISMGLQENQVQRAPWHQPILRRSDITLYTRQHANAYNDGSGAS